MLEKIRAIDRTIPTIIPSTIPMKRVVPKVDINSIASNLLVSHNLTANLKSNKLKTAVIIIAASTERGR